MIETILTSSVLILFLTGLRYLLRGKINLRLQYALWALVALRLLLPPGGQVLMDRGCHKSVYRALALLDGRPTYLYPGCLEPFHAAAPVTAEAVDAALCATRSGTS